MPLVKSGSIRRNTANSVKQAKVKGIVRGISPKRVDGEVSKIRSQARNTESTLKLNTYNRAVEELFARNNTGRTSKARAKQVANIRSKLKKTGAADKSIQRVAELRSDAAKKLLQNRAQLKKIGWKRKI